MRNDFESESYRRSTGLAIGDPEAVANATRDLDSIWVLPISAQRKVVADMWETMIDGITSYSCTRNDFVELREKLAKISSDIDLEAYECIFGLMYRYDEIPDNAAHDLAFRNVIDTNIKTRVIRVGSIVAQLRTEESSLCDSLKQSILRTAEKALDFTLKHGGPDTKSVAREALEIEKGLDLSELISPLDTGRSDYDKAMFNFNFFEKKYPHEGLPKRFIVDATYESIRQIFSNPNVVEKNYESSVAIRQLKSLLSSSENWGRTLFPIERDIDYENQLERELIVTDIQKALLHVVRNGKDDSLRAEVAKVLAENGDERVKDIFRKMVKSKDEGFDFVRKFTIPKSTKRAEKPLPRKPAPKKAVR